MDNNILYCIVYIMKKKCYLLEKNIKIKELVVYQLKIKKKKFGATKYITYINGESLRLLSSRKTCSSNEPI